MTVRGVITVKGGLVMTVITAAEAPANLSQWIDRLAPGRELVITRDARPVAQLIGLAAGRAEKPRSIHPGPRKKEARHLVRRRCLSARLQAFHIVRLLLDAHAPPWFHPDDARRGGRARAAIVDSNNDKLVSPASHGEIAVKISIGG